MSENQDKFITLVIHTPLRAAHLEGFLKSHDIPVEIVPVDVPDYEGEKPVRVRIPVDKLQLGLKILESGEDYSTSQIMIKMAGMSGNMLIPVDFSPSSFLAVRVGFFIAEKTGMSPVIMHAVMEPIPAIPDPSPDDIPEVDEVLEVEEAKQLNRDAMKRMRDFKKQIAAKQQKGELPKVKFTTTVLEGVAEEVILQYCRIHNPSMVVMATRGKDKKDEELIGSVTAEVLDSCRTPLFTVPDNFQPHGLDDFKRIIMFCTMERHDFLSIRAIMKAFSYPAIEVYLVPVVEHVGQDAARKLSEMRDAFAQTYPTATFHAHHVKGKNFSEQIDEFIREMDIRMMIVPNRKTNIFRRIFRPSIAHRCLFQHDLPMLVLPV